MMAKRSLARKSFVWVGFAAIGAGVWFGVINPLLAWKHDTEMQLASELSKRDRLKGSIANLQLEQATLSAETKFTDLWVAETPNEATALVQAALSTLSRKEGVTFRSIAPLQSPDIPLVDGVAFRVETELTLDRLVDFLKTLEYSAPVLVVERANLRRVARSSAGAGQPSLFVQLDITAPVILPEDGS